jgi:glycolate oxidase iron-sulfur subunit
MAHAVQTCVHCGFCLSACPTYQEFGQEMDTPRGRIVLMKQVLEGELSCPPRRSRTSTAASAASRASPPARAACLIATSSARIARRSRRSARSRAPAARSCGISWLAGKTMPYPARLRLGALLGAKLGKAFRPLVLRALRPMLDLAPAAVRCRPWRCRA